MRAWCGELACSIVLFLFLDESDDETINEKDMPTIALVEISQLMLLFRFCYKCNWPLLQKRVNVTFFVGNPKVRYWCENCHCHREWRGQSKAPSGFPTATLRLVTAAFTSAVSFYVSALSPTLRQLKIFFC